MLSKFFRLFSTVERKGSTKKIKRHDKSFILDVEGEELYIRSGSILNPVYKKDNPTEMEKKFAPSVKTIAYSDDNRFLAFSNEYHEIKIFNIPDNRLVRTLKEDRGEIMALGLKDDRNIATLVSNSYNSYTLIFRDINSGVVTSEITVSDLFIRAFSMNLRAGYIVTGGSSDGNITVRRLGGERIFEAKGHEMEVWSVAINSSGDCIVSVGRGYTPEDVIINIWTRNLLSFSSVQSFRGFQTGRSVSISSDCEFFVTGGKNGVNQVWSTQFGNMRSLEAHTGSVNALMITSDDRYIVSGGEEGLIKIWDSTTLENIAIFYVDGDKWVVWSPLTSRWDASEEGIALVKIKDRKTGQEYKYGDRECNELHTPGLLSQIFH